MKYSLIILIMILTSCSVHKHNDLTRPYVITEKSIDLYDPNVIEYRGIDVNGVDFFYYDNSDSYEIGDTIQ